MALLAFDIYGTLIDTHGVIQMLEAKLANKEKALAFSNTWRDKQLEYSFRRGLMRDYKNFGICTAQALDYCDSFYKTNLSQDDKQDLLNAYKTLPSFADVKTCLKQIDKTKHQCVAFSNGTTAAVKNLLENADIETYFSTIISVDDLQTFKPNPGVYQYLVKQCQSTLEETWLISSNSFDVIGASAAGLNTVWLQRHSTAVFDPWHIKPDEKINNLNQLLDILK